MEKWKDRKMLAVLYPDDPTHVSAIEKLLDGWSFAGILHDKDVDDNGEPKKPHWHIVLRLGGLRWSTAVADELGIEHNYLEKCVSFDSSLLYLIHYNAPEKYQYQVEEAFGPLTIKLKALYDAQFDEGAHILQIVDMIDSCGGRASYRDILIRSCKAGLWTNFRHLGAGVKYLIDEHNELVDNDLIAIK